MSTDYILPPPVFHPRSARVEANRKRPYRVFKFTGNGGRYNLPITELQARRLDAKNNRRALNGLPPRESYAQI